MKPRLPCLLDFAFRSPCLAADDSVIKNLMHGLQKCTKIELGRDWWMYALRSWETSADTMIKEYKETLNEEEVFVMTAAQQLVERGELKGKRETARTMLADGLSIDMVDKYTNLGTAFLLKLRNEIDSKTQH